MVKDDNSEQSDLSVSDGNLSSLDEWPLSSETVGSLTTCNFPERRSDGLKKMCSGFDLQLPDGKAALLQYGHFPDWEDFSGNELLLSDCEDIEVFGKEEPLLEDEKICPLDGITNSKWIACLLDEPHCPEWLGCLSFDISDWEEPFLDKRLCFLETSFFFRNWEPLFDSAPIRFTLWLEDFGLGPGLEAWEPELCHCCKSLGMKRNTNWLGIKKYSKKS